MGAGVGNRDSGIGGGLPRSLPSDHAHIKGLMVSYALEFRIPIPANRRVA
jgi:hypothetical protein